MSYVNENSWVENCVIGRYCSISSHVMICPGEHYIYDRSLSYPVWGCPRTEPVRIGDDVLISYGVIILSGVTIGDGAVIGAGTVVSKDVSPYTVVVGGQRTICSRFDAEKIRKIRESRLYDKRLNEIESFCDLDSL